MEHDVVCIGEPSAHPVRVSDTHSLFYISPLTAARSQPPARPIRAEKAKLEP